jgi:hypothetical protein
MIDAIVIVVLLAGLTVLPAAAAPPITTLTSAERPAVFKAAGFKARGDRYIRCEEEPPTASYTPGAIEVIDLNGDGRPEAWVTESSLFCYGNTAAFFVLVTKDEGGMWRKLMEGAGVPTALDTKHQGWPDIEVGGPGFGKFPVQRWNGKPYVERGAAS